jgi:hypothetical protein
MLTRMRRRAALVLAAAATAALVSGAGAAPATAADFYVHSFQLTLSPANTKASATGASRSSRCDRRPAGSTARATRAR